MDIFIDMFIVSVLVMGAVLLVDGLLWWRGVPTISDFARAHPWVRASLVALSLLPAIFLAAHLFS